MRSRLWGLAVLAMIGPAAAVASAYAATPSYTGDVRPWIEKLKQGADITGTQVSVPVCRGTQGPDANSLAGAILAYAGKHPKDLGKAIQTIASKYKTSACLSAWTEFVKALEERTRGTSLAFQQDVHTTEWARDLSPFVAAASAVQDTGRSKGNSKLVDTPIAPAPGTNGGVQQPNASKTTSVPWFAWLVVVLPVSVPWFAWLAVALPAALMVAVGVVLVAKRERARPVRGRREEPAAGTSFPPPPSPIPDETLADLETRLVAIDAGVRLCNKSVQAITEQLLAMSTVPRLHARFEELLALVRSQSSTPPDLSALQELAVGNQRLLALMERLIAQVDGLRQAEPPQPPIEVEREALREAWKQFSASAMAAELNGVRNDGWQQINGPLLSDLPKLVPEELRESLWTATAAARDYYQLTAKLDLIPKVLRRGADLSSPTLEIKRLRELNQLLNMIQSSNLMADRLRFNFASWVTDHFVGFADLLLQSYQKAQLEGRPEELEPAAQIVRQVLSVAGLAPIEVALGSTQFDSTRHIGRSTTRDPNYADGVILGVVRNGFLRGGREVVRQPEVIVNRVR